MKSLWLFPILFVACAVVLLAGGCSAILYEKTPEKTRIVAAPFGSTERTPKFKHGEEKPSGHVIWGKDVNDGARCSIVISNVSLSRMVYRHDFIYRKDAVHDGFNYFPGPILELNPLWYRKVGAFLVALYVNNERISTDSFAILP